MNELEMKSSVEIAASKLSEYWRTYNDQHGINNYTKKIFLNDALYGIGIAMSEKYMFADGYAQFKS